MEQAGEVSAGIFVDSSAWIALSDKKDENHTPARRFFSLIFTENGQVVSTNHVIGETYTFVCHRLGYSLAQQFLTSVRESQRLKNIFVSREQEEKAYGLLARYRDQRLSFVDATSFVVMRENRMSECFTFDRHFAAVGFRCLPS
ncbi:MAG: PIN domain-containing protein [Chloroflexi bacterium]|nr:PIN domain-containing protein [Chloroflexota bacterium]